MLLLKCRHEPDHSHEFPDDWQFGGASECDPRADPRWRPSVYTYLDANLREVWSTSVPFCEDEALDRFTDHRAFKPVYLQVTSNGETRLLPWVYDADTDMLSPLKA